MMLRRRRDHRIPAAIVFVAFCAGMIFAWWLQSYGPPQPAIDEEAQLRTEAGVPPSTLPPAAPARSEGGPPDRAHSIGTGSDSVNRNPVGTSGDIPRRRLQVPVDGADVKSWKGGFYERRNGRSHEAVDILAPRNTPVRAVDEGRIAKLFVSKAGGNTIYQFDPEGRLCYYYAHLERYADGLHEGQAVSRGQVIGYVGTSGNAPPETPHLHFAVIELNEDRRWWQGRALDPYELFRH
jgi:murein DD-endopeptidase MepM/ murein hydrolase activator NlpD